MLLASLRQPRAGVYVLVDCCRCPEALDPALLRAAWTHLAERHPALRTEIVLTPAGDAVQQAAADPRCEWLELDWRAVASEQIEARLESQIESDRRAGFGFTSGVPIRLTFIRIGDSESAIVCSVHHALLDGRSLVTVWREWFEVYEALAADEPRALPGVPNDQDRSQSEDETRRYWSQHLDGLSAAAGAITDRLQRAAPPPSEPYGDLHFSFDRDVTPRLDAFARANGVTLSTLVTGAWALLLSCYGERDEVVFGVTQSGRSAEQAGLVGLRINTTPFRIAVDAETQLVEWLQAIRREAVAQRAFQRTSPEQAFEWGGCSPGTAFDSVVVYDREPRQATLRRLGGKWERRTLRRYHRSATPLLLGAYGSPELSLHLGYDAGRYTAATAAAMLSSLGTIIEGFLQHPEGRLADIRWLAAVECEALTRTDALPVDESLCVHDLFAAQVFRDPSHAALEADGETIGYAELNARANRLAHHLREQGAGPEDLVAVCLPDARDAIVAMLAILKAGAAFLCIDPALPEERRETMLRLSAPSFSLTAIDDHPEQPEHDPPPVATSDNAAYAVFTSGSTGPPKAIVVTHRSLVNHTLAVAPVYGLTPSDRRLQFASPGSDVFIAEVFNYLCTGGTIVICEGARRASLREFDALLRQHRITITACPGSWWNTWVQALSEGATNVPETLRTVIVGMESADAFAFRRWRTSSGSGLRWFNAYGPAENSPTSTIYEAGSSAWECESILPIGRPIANTTAYVLDRQLRLLPPGVAGELYLGGADVSRGYRGMPELTAASFLDDPFHAGGRMYPTGDRAYALPDGNLVFLGRADRQVKIRGYRVELDEIESALARHEGVTACAVVAAGEGGRRRLLAYVVSDVPSEPIWRACCRRTWFPLPG